MLALFAFQMLPINWAGVALIGLGAALMIAEVFLPSFGALGVGGIIAFVLGGLFLIDSEVPGFGIPLPFLFRHRAGQRGPHLRGRHGGPQERKRAVVAGREELPGSFGVITLVDDDGARAMVHGESWQVRAAGPLAPGQRIPCQEDRWPDTRGGTGGRPPPTGARHDPL